MISKTIDLNARVAGPIITEHDIIDKSSDAQLPNVDPSDGLDDLDEVLLMVVVEAGAPVGARMVAKLLREKGPSLSEATISRHLVRLDELGLTMSAARKGRLPTARGRDCVEARIERDRRNRDFDRATEMRTVDEIIDWLEARKLLERQAAALTADRATPTQIDEMIDSVTRLECTFSRGDDPTPVGLDFHRMVARACQSPIFNALINTLYTPKLIGLERALDVILRAHGTIGDSVTDHRDVLVAIQNNDPETASAAMSDHLERLRVETQRFQERFSAQGPDEAIRLIQVARTN